MSKKLFRRLNEPAVPTTTLIKAPRETVKKITLKAFRDADATVKDELLVLLDSTRFLAFGAWRLALYPTVITNDFGTNIGKGELKKDCRCPIGSIAEPVNHNMEYPTLPWAPSIYVSRYDSAMGAFFGKSQGVVELQD